jgi:hypothetical protein
MSNSLEDRIVRFLETNGYKDVRVLSRLNILHHEWECDPYIYAVETNLGKRIVGTTHGMPCLVSRQELEHKIEEYQDLINAYSNLLSDGNDW